MYGRNDKDTERLNNLISSYECVLESANKGRQRSPFEGRRLTYKDQSSIQMLSNKQKGISEPYIGDDDTYGHDPIYDS